MAYKQFNETLVWKKTEAFVNELQQRINTEIAPWFSDQLLQTACKAAIQVAEGHERYKDSERIKYLDFARDNMIKCRAMLAMAGSMGVLAENDVETLEEKAVEASKVNFGLSKFLKNKLADAA